MARQNKDHSDDSKECKKHFKKCDEKERCYYTTIYRPVRVKHVIKTSRFEEQIYPCRGGKHYTHAYNKKCEKSKEKSKDKSRDW